MAGHLTLGWQFKAANLRLLVDEAAALIQALDRRDPFMVPRDGIVRVLSH